MINFKIKTPYRRRRAQTQLKTLEYNNNKIETIIHTQIQQNYPIETSLDSLKRERIIKKITATV